MKTLLTIIKYILLGVGATLLAIAAIGMCMLLVAAVVTKEWLMIPVALIPIWGFFCLLDSSP